MTLQGMAMIQSVVRATRPRRPATRSAARAQPGQVRMLRYKVCIVSWAAPRSRYKKNVSAEGGNFGSHYNVPGLRYGATMHHDIALGATTHTATRATRRSACATGARVGIQILYLNRKGPTTRPYIATQHCDTARQHARALNNTATTRPGIGYDTTGGRPRQGAWCATTWPAQRAA